MNIFTIWLNKQKVTFYIGGNPVKGQAPVITLTMDNPQILVDQLKNTITIVETK